MKKNIYEVDKNIECLLRGGATRFLSCHIAKEIQGKVKKKNYQVFSPFSEADKVILYGVDEMPSVLLYRIDCYEKDKDKIKHSSILGSLLGLNIDPEMFGDIVWYEGYFYVYLLEEIKDLIIQQLQMVGNIPIHLTEVDVHFLDNYERTYEEHPLIVASVRIDTVIARLIGSNRERVQKMIQEKLVMLNGEVLNRNSYLLRDGDIFSIRKWGKYRYTGVTKETKKKNFIIIVKKYL